MSKEFIYHDTLQDITIVPTPLPEVTPLPITETSLPFNAASRQQYPVDLASYGYVEEEYLVSGCSNIYEYYDVGLYPKIRAENGPYCTRILVRRPADRTKFSGVAILELMNYAGPCEKAQAGWGSCYEYYMKSGDAWIGITAKQNVIDQLKRYDPERYAPLGFPNPVPPEKRRKPISMFGPGMANGDVENGLFYDAYSQVAALLKTATQSNPLCRSEGRPFPPAKYVLATGASGCDLSLYVAALQPFATMDGKKPVFDGFLIHMTGYPGMISNGEKRFSADDDRCKLYANVPLIWTQTMGDMLGGGVHPSYSYMYRHPESDLPGRQFRQYEIAAAPIMSEYDRRVFPCIEDIAKAGGNVDDKQYDPAADHGDFPTRYVLRAAMHALKRWVIDGVPAPRSDWLELEGKYPDAVFVLDEYGNPKGGIRSPYVDVPIKTYKWDDNFAPNNILIPFSSEKLHELYPTHADYVKKVVASTLDMMSKGFLLPEDAAAVIGEAIDSTIPD